MSADWLGRAASLSTDFHEARPFPLLVMDGFLTEDAARGLESEFPCIEDMPKSRDYVFGNKHELSSVEQAGIYGRAFHQAVTSPGFADFLKVVTGWDLLVDPSFHGGGFHQGGDGSFLDMHVDFNVHPLHSGWLRTLNILIYLNPKWDDAWGGDLLVKAALDEAPRSIAPKFNRGVLMLTSDHTYHGYRRMNLPADVTRKSLATYAYRVIEGEAVRARTTGWVPEEAGMAKRLLARHYDRLVRLKNRILGSSTARNR